MKPAAYEGTFHGERAVWLSCGRYEAAVLPEIGANLIAFRDTDRQYRFLREPEPDEMEVFKQKPYVHGIPVLFPPNRYEDGLFPWQSQVYRFPVNEPETGNHLHGFLHDIPWKAESWGSDDYCSRVTLILNVGPDHPVYAFFPHTFTFRLQYSLSEDGLQQHVMVRNDGSSSMPCLLAFHTAVNAPFAPGSSASDCRVKLTERMLPTGEFQPLTAEEEALKDGGIYPFFRPMDNHYTALPQNGRNRMELTDTRIGTILVYDAGTSYKQWMIWNNNAAEGFFCPEPQISLVNAPNVPLPAEKTGLYSLKPGEIWEETSRLYCRNADF